MRGIDWQLIAFVTLSLLHDHWVYSKFPKLYFYDVGSTTDSDDAKRG